MWWLYRYCLPGLFLTCFLIGCGFQPVYKQQDSNISLHTIDIAPTKGRHGQLLRTHLEDLLNPTSKSSETFYTLQTNINVNLIPLIVEADGTVSRYRIDITTPFTLINQQNNQAIYQDKIDYSVSYNVSDADYSTYVTSKFTEEEAIRVVSNNIFMRLAAFISKRDKGNKT